MKRNIIQRIARHILKEEILKRIEHQRSIVGELNRCKRQIDYLQGVYQQESKKNSELRHEVIELKRINYTIPDFMLCAVINALPNPNDFANGNINSHDLFDGQIITMDWMGKHDIVPRKARCRFSKVRKGGLKVEFVDLDLKVFIPCKKETLNYNLCGIMTEVDTYVWDFNSIGIAVISAGTYDRLINIFNGQRAAIEQFNY